MCACVRANRFFGLLLFIDSSALCDRTVPSQFLPMFLVWLSRKLISTTKQSGAAAAAAAAVVAVAHRARRPVTHKRNR
jgi:hypothetical protein